MADKYFTLGYSGNQTTERYALYDPLSKVFLFVGSDLERLLKIKILESRRNTLVVCKISSAVNFYNNMIDNQCCQNWSISNQDNIDLLNYNVITVKELVEIAQAENNEESQHKFLLQMINFYCEFLEHLEKFRSWHLVNNFMLEMIDIELLNFKYSDIGVLNNLDYVKFNVDLQKKIYFGTHIETIESAITKSIIDHQYENVYQNWLKNIWAGRNEQIPC